MIDTFLGAWASIRIYIAANEVVRCYGLEGIGGEVGLEWGQVWLRRRHAVARPAAGAGLLNVGHEPRPIDAVVGPAAHARGPLVGRVEGL
jgi:hypothetical protein